MFPAVITALAFIITFIVVGLVVVAAAFSGGRRDAGRAPGPVRARRRPGGGRRDAERPAGPSRRARRTVALGVGALVLLLGVLVPALVIAAARSTEKGP